MHIEELKEKDSEFGGGGRGEEELLIESYYCKEIVVSDTKRALVGAGARVLFYPTLLYNVLRNKIQAEFRWWDEINQFLLLGAVPFPTDVPRLKQLGVCGVVTLNESYETLVPTSLYHAHDIEHLVLPTRDYLFAPAHGDICEAVDFIYKNTMKGKKTYVHCKAGRGRSTTIVLCYLVQHKQMTPEAAYEYVRSIRSRVLLAPAQWQAVQQFYHLRMKSKRRAIRWSTRTSSQSEKLGLCAAAVSPLLHDSEDTNDSSVVLTRLNPSHFAVKTTGFSTRRDVTAFDDNSVVVITESDLDGYDDNNEVANDICAAEVSIVYKVQFASQAALARLSGLRLRYITSQKISGKKLGSKNSCSVGADKLGGVGVDIHVY
ncbi:Phosphatidylglycerophosphatase and protein-tyrosine phosphatase [Thalictrum thalictroides]|uniref:phosphatidylglycerophosphatase n=1 Tax=Thalictrum thalictroides TaxID=46969 RepID=A0A7J6XDA3_THATH|nr:Phosphatidylglycerophosphatase and protein-tyrosine phosphatase [Thalictrum thalictroides]